LRAYRPAPTLPSISNDQERRLVFLSSAQEASNPAEIAAQKTAPRAVAVWLFGVCALIFLMVVVGGITRLTLSGLSITEWHPIIGVIPPLTAPQWAAAFADYQKVPEYRALHYGMSLADFKSIYFWEYAHRLLGRLIGIAFAAPLVWFWMRRRLPQRLAPALVGILALGFAQGLLGWYMVESGLADRLEVSQYRLVAHLVLALAIYSLILWTALSLLGRTASALARPSPPFRGEREGPIAQQWEDEVGAGNQRRLPHLTPALSAPEGGEGAFLWRRAAEPLIALVALTIAAGGFVAGTRAGLTYNTFPLMDGRWIPAGYARLQPFIRNWFENIPAVQFDHRLLAETTLLCVLGLVVAALRAPLPRPAAHALTALAAAALLQVALGVSTLLLVVPVPLAAAHQAGAVLLLTAAIVFRHTLRPPPIVAKTPAIL
jgi:heme a synthase